MKEAAVKDGVIKNKTELQLARVVMMVWAALCITSMAAAVKGFTWWKENVYTKWKKDLWGKRVGKVGVGGFRWEMLKVSGQTPTKVRWKITWASAHHTFGCTLGWRLHKKMHAKCIIYRNSKFKGFQPWSEAWIFNSRTFVIFNLSHFSMCLDWKHSMWNTNRRVQTVSAPVLHQFILVYGTNWDTFSNATILYEKQSNS